MRLEIIPTLRTSIDLSSSTIYTVRTRHPSPGFSLLNIRISRLFSCATLPSGFLPRNQRQSLHQAIAEDATVATMDQEERESMLTILRPLAKKLGPLGREAYRWSSLQRHLARFDGQYLKQHSTSIVDLFHDCLNNSAPSNTISANSSRKTTPLDNASATSLARPPTPAIDNNTSSSNKVDDGFIQSVALHGARFSYSDREDNLVSWHILKRCGLVNEVKNNKIVLTFFLQSRPKRSYKLEFKAKRRASFDVQLGSKWEDEDEELEEKLARMRLRPNQMQMARSGSTGVECPPPFLLPASYLGEALGSTIRSLYGGDNGAGFLSAKSPLEIETVAAPRFPSPLPAARTEAGMWGARRDSKVECIASPTPFESISSHEARAGESSRLNSRLKQDQGSSASTSATDLSDNFDNDHEDERDKYSESSAPELEEDSRESGIYNSDKMLLAYIPINLEEKCYENPWSGGHGG